MRWYTNSLGEFDFCVGSGWMYSVDNDFPGVGASNWQMSDGEVMRWQFTVWGYGADLNADNTAWGSSSIVNVGDKGSLTWAVAELGASTTTRFWRPTRSIWTPWRF